MYFRIDPGDSGELYEDWIDDPYAEIDADPDAWDPYLDESDVTP